MKDGSGFEHLGSDSMILQGHFVQGQRLDLFAEVGQLQVHPVDDLGFLNSRLRLHIFAADHVNILEVNLATGIFPNLPEQALFLFKHLALLDQFFHHRNGERHRYSFGGA